MGGGGWRGETFNFFLAYILFPQEKMKTHIQELFFLRENENTLTKKVEINED